MGRLAFATSSRRLGLLRRRRNLAAVVATVVGLVSVACTNTIAPNAVNSVTVLPASDSVEVGSVLSGFTATAFDVSGKEVTGKKVTWKTLNPDIATVDANGQVTGVKLGFTRLIATVGGQPSGQIPVKVISKATRIIVVPDSIDVSLTTTKTLTGAVFDAAGSSIPGRVIIWSSDNPLVATVTSGGIVSAISVGQTNVYATVGTLFTTVKVRVTPERVASVRITNPLTGSYILRLGNSVQITAQALNSQNVPLPGRVYQWTSSNPAVASVSNTGLVTGNSLGTATVGVQCEGLVDQIQIQVTPIPVASVVILPTDPTLFVGQNAQLVAIVKDSAGNALSTLGRVVAWVSSNQTVAAVNNNGVLSAISAGTSIVQVIVDQVLSPAITVTVNLKPVVSVQVVAPSAQQLKVGVSFQLQAVLRDIDGNVLSNRPVTWVSADPLIATVTVNGLMQGIAVGPVKITATSEGISGDVVITIIP
jgi:uncharacterized protein YjdB